MISRALVLLRSLNILCESGKSTLIILRAMRTTLNSEPRSSQALLPNRTIIEPIKVLSIMLRRNGNGNTA